MNAPRSSDGVGTSRIVTSALGGGLEVGRRAQSRSRERRDEVLESRLLDGRAPLVQQPHGLGVDVDAEDVVALAREHGGERRAELAESDDGDPHRGYAASAVTSRCQPNRRSKRAEERLRHPAEVRLLHVAVLDVVADPVREDVIDARRRGRGSRALDELTRLRAACR